MKKLILIALAALTLNTAAQAQDLYGSFELDQDAVGLLPIEGSVVSTEVNGFVFLACPSNAMCMPVSKVAIDLNFTLVGCVDELGPVTYTYERSEDRTHATIYVSAINVIHELSAHVKCFVAKTEQRKLELTMSAGLESVEVKFLTVPVSAR